MNEVDQKILTGVAITGLVLSIGLRASTKPVSFLGLDTDNTRKLVAGVTVLSGGLLLIGALKSAKA